MIIQTIYQILNVLKKSGHKQDVSYKVLIGRFLNEEEISRAWADCITCV
jgi:hypothetical protein